MIVTIESKVSIEYIKDTKVFLILGDRSLKPGSTL